MKGLDTMATKSTLQPVIHVSKPTANSKGGVEYVELSGPEATRILMTHGLTNMLGMFGLQHVQPWQVYLSNAGYGDARTFCVRIRRDVAEGRETERQDKAAPMEKPVWQAPRGAVAGTMAAAAAGRRGRRG